MAHRYLGRSLFILVIYFVALSISRVTPAARAPAPKTNNCTKFSYPGVSPGYCTERRDMKLITKFKNGTKVFSCPLLTDICVNARMSGVWCVNNSAIGSLFFTSTSHTPPMFHGFTPTHHRRLSGLWVDYQTGYLYVYPNATKKPEKEIYCTLTICITAITTRRPTTTRSSRGVSTGISTTGLWTDETSVVFPFVSAGENFGVSASPQTASSGTIAAIVIVIVICVGLVVLAVLYYRGYIGHSRRLNLYRERLRARFLVSHSSYPTSYSTRYPSTYIDRHHDPSDPTYFLPPLHISTSAA
ncbi:glycoprotein family protein m11 [Murid betaherpesvirus 1]|uniref:Glycoprotein family protein m11 n=2 Tax=Murid herpesvirus 1 TaxID=10366 RepID=D3XDJ5_MUHVS|nr:glycoprotein family protein m11 [Murid betaherpesvirus 1]YP_214019.1 Glycoprotein family m02 [Murid betaherpesvirus 1]CAP08055.1 m11 protein [Murine cytomegalovirus (strain K181)]ADD10389.1 glycoprotein family protein m11 [Murid betaherpesvirus 1]AQQ81300.1 m11 protein [Murid betaherpesvirus 1]WEG71673.1 membrane protein m11 [Murid betaherpesvirus 1]CAJ1013231.1 m11 protein [Murid betaherpesvirus 1]